MRNPSFLAVSTVVRRLSLALVTGAVLGTSVLAQAGEKTPADMPWFMQPMPDAAQQAAWAMTKEIMGPNTAIPPKYKELIGLAVASQIPCQYCVYGHTKGAEKNGATTEEIREAIAVGALIRMWSTVVQGNQTDFQKFKATVDGVSE